MPPLSEAALEAHAIELLKEQGYVYLSPDEHHTERSSTNDIVLQTRLKNAVQKLNPKIPQEAKDEGLRAVLNLPRQNHRHLLMESNEEFHRFLNEGVGVEYQKNGDTVGGRVCLIDFENPLENDLLVLNQFTVNESCSGQHIRPDIVLFINGLPLVVIELKNPFDANASVHKAFTQLQNYKEAAQSLFTYNGILAISDGYEAKAGSLNAEWQRFMSWNWKTIDGVKEEKKTTLQLETLIKGMLRPDVLLDLLRYFTVFEKIKKQDSQSRQSSIELKKKLAAYHQYHAVNKAVEATVRAIGGKALPLNYNEKSTPYFMAAKPRTQKQGDGKAGIIWHTQGSGKSLSMAFYAGKLMVDPRMENPTIVVVTDRNDLDGQLFDTFAAARNLLGGEPVQASNRNHLKKLLKTAGGGIVFSTIQKFSPEDSNTEEFDLLSLRKNIVVIADEAHRSQYGFASRVVSKENTVKNKGKSYIKYGFAKYLRDALPKASFIGFTATPIETEDASTPAVFGNYIDIYDIEQSVKDKATVPIYYESRLVKLQLKDKEKLDAKAEQISEGQESTATQKAKAKWTSLEALVGHKKRLEMVAKDIIEHFELRQSFLEGKGMIVAMSRRIAVALYDEIIRLRPDWEDKNKDKGQIKIVMTSNKSDPSNWQIHNTNKYERKALSERFKNPNDSLKLVIVRDMWLTGFDVPCLHTMYIDKLIWGHNLMQAIARVNRVYKNKPGGLVVDYIGITSDLKNAILSYAGSGGKGSLSLDQSEAVKIMEEKYELVTQFFHRFNYKRYFSAQIGEKMNIILEAQEHISKLSDDGKKRFFEQTNLLTKAFALSIPHPKALKLRDEIGFFQAVKSRLSKLGTSQGKRDSDEMESAIKQIVDKAISPKGVIDIFDAAGIKKPDISVLSQEFLDEIRSMKHTNLAVELLRKILNNEIKSRMKTNLIQSKKLSEMLSTVIDKYNNNLQTAKEILKELIELAKNINKIDERGKSMNLTNDELAFYDALAHNESAREIMKDKTLRELAIILVREVRANTSIDWTIKTSVQAKLRLHVKEILHKYGYPPDKQKLATENILEQAALFSHSSLQ